MSDTLPSPAMDSDEAPLCIPHSVLEFASLDTRIVADAIYALAMEVRDLRKSLKQLK